MNKTNKNIPATLDFNKSLENFVTTITPVLELTNVAEWDGQTLKQREELLKVAALVQHGVNAFTIKLPIPYLYKST